MTKTTVNSLLVTAILLFACLVSIQAAPPPGYPRHTFLRRRVCLDTEGVGPTGAPGWQTSQACGGDGECASGKLIL
jgi:hypothetical protein